MQTVRPEDRLSRDQRFLDWLRAHALKPEDTAEVSFTNDYIKATVVARNKDGHKQLDPTIPYEPIKVEHVVRVRKPWSPHNGT